MANIDMPNIGAIIPTVRGRKIAYAIFAAISLVAGNTLVFYAATVGQIPLWLIGVTAVITNTAPAFSAVAIANAVKPAEGQAVTPVVSDVSVIDGLIDTTPV